MGVGQPSFHTSIHQGPTNLHWHHTPILEESVGINKITPMSDKKKLKKIVSGLLKTSYHNWYVKMAGFIN